MMATLITVSNSDGVVIGRCDAKCYDAKHEKCNCICGGKNHGIGRKKAEQNTREHAQATIERWRRLGDPSNIITIAEPTLFGEED